MKTSTNSRKDAAKKKAFTLVEMTVVVIFGLAITSSGMLLLNQQIQTAQILRDQDFILLEAPKINSTFNSLLGNADAIRLHQNFNDAVNDSNPVLTDAKTLVTAYRNFDNSTSFGIISLEMVGNSNQLNYYLFDGASSLTPPVQASPSWSISRRVEDVDFDLIDGIFVLTLTGPNAEQITYTISPNQ